MKTLYPLLLGASLMVGLGLGMPAVVTAEETPEFIRLRDGYVGAVERATKPLRATYVAELLKMRDALTKAGKTAAVETVQGEIEAMSESKAAGATAGKGPDARWFMGKSWGTGRGATWKFDKTGNQGEKLKNGVRSATFTWVVDPSTGVLQLTEKVAGAAGTGMTLIRFKDRNEAYAGSTPETMTARLVPE